MVLQTLAKRTADQVCAYVPDRKNTTPSEYSRRSVFHHSHRPRGRSGRHRLGAWMGGMRGAVLMQTSGFATLANAGLAMIPIDSG
jgi:hypothetical protein